MRPEAGIVNVGNVPAVNAQQSGPWNISVSGTPVVNAQQTGTWNVGLTGTPNVQLISSLANPVVVQQVDTANRFTTSGRGVILAGQTFTNVSLPVPTCPAGTDFLVTDAYVGPEILIGATSIDVVQLADWGFSQALRRHKGSLL